jgi:hypothetical protein
MFVGHYSVSFATRRSPVDLPLWVWFVAVQWLDFVFMTLLLLGVEKLRIVPGFTQSNALDLYYMPYTHGLVGATVLSAIFAVLVAAIFPVARSGPGLALLWLASFSHWILDLLVHTPDLPLLAGPQKVGLGLWNHLAIELPLEIVLLALGAWFYTRGSGNARRVWIFFSAMVLLQLYSTFGPPSPSPTMFAITALAAYGLMTAGAVWVERGHARPTVPESPSAGH